MSADLKQFALETFGECFTFMREPLANYELFTQKLSQMIKVKEGQNEQFDFDVELDAMIRRGLEKHGITGRVFSEESGFFDLPGEQNYRVVYDPFCNSSLAARTFREGAAGLSIFSYDYEFLTSIIIDYQSGIMGMVEDGKTHFYQLPTGVEITINRPAATKLADAWVVLTLENTRERAHLAEAAEIMQTAKHVISTSGHMYWLKLAAGFIDAYTDPFGGEALYEMFACTLAQHAGCTVTDRQGRPFEPAKYLRIFEADQKHLFYPVAARTEALHAELLRSLRQEDMIE